MSQNDTLGRRQFLKTASILMGQAGLCSMAKADFLEILARKIVPAAHAATPSKTADFFIEICSFGGMPIFPFGVSSQLVGQGTNYPNLAVNNLNNFSNQSGIMMSSVGVNGLRPLSQTLGPHASEIAISQGFDAGGIPHEEAFAHRKGGKGGSMVSPAVLKAANASTAVGGVMWYRSRVQNMTAGRQDLVDVGSVAAFNNLYAEPELRLKQALNQQAVDAVANAISRLSQSQSRYLASRIQDIDAATTSQASGSELLKKNNEALLNTNGMDSDFFINPGMGNFGSRDFGRALAKTCKAFENQLLSVAVLSTPPGDWHGNQSNAADTRQGRLAGYVGQTVGAAIRYLKATPHPYRPGESMWDRTLIQIGTEFSRGLTVANTNNRDGISTGFVYMGGAVKGGYYGGFSGNRILGFNRTTGAASGSMNDVRSIYNTTMSLLGESERTTGGELDCLIKS